PGPMTWLPVLERVNVLARVAPVLGPGLINKRSPVALVFCLYGGLHRDHHGAGLYIGGQFCARLVLVVNVPPEIYRLHGCFLTPRTRFPPRPSACARCRSSSRLRARPSLPGQSAAPPRGRTSRA